MDEKMHFMTEPEELLNWMKEHEEFKVMNKEDLIFLVEDTEGNKFGQYLHSRITGYYPIRDPNSFLFSLQSNGRINGMMKFEIKDAKNTFYLDHQSSDY